MWRYITLIIIMTWSCRATDPNDIGDFIVEVQCYHHADPVGLIDVHLMEYAEDFPGDDLSEYHFKVTADSTGKALFSKILAGHHWIYGYGTDEADTVKGNKPIFIDPQDEDGKIRIILQVSEKH
ncbi:MAG: hypothetical protein R3275_08250 [Saprospiraceae bacterium]|nr:hypothetical protein [Saprospiraceae bacterium]